MPLDSFFFTNVSKLYQICPCNYSIPVFCLWHIICYLWA